MITDKTGGPAFPFEHNRSEAMYCSNGMTLWDWYAGQAMAGLMSDSTILQSASITAAQIGKRNEEVMALLCSEFADAVIAERNKRGIV